MPDRRNTVLNPDHSSSMENPQDKVTSWVRSQILDLNAYHVPKAESLIKLDAMENPYTWPSELIDQWITVLRNIPLNRYPDPGAVDLKQQLRTAMGVPDCAEILLGNGSDELIQMIALTLRGKDRTILALEPSFVMYRMIAVYADLNFHGVPLQDDFSLDIDATLTAIKTYQPAVVFLAYPNNPTGNLFNREHIQKIIQAAPGLVVVDEAYHAFAGDSFMADLKTYDNLLLMRTLSKSGLAGLRLGILAGPQAWLDQLNKVRLPYNINVLTQASTIFALQHQDILDQQAMLICKNRRSLFSQLTKLKDITAHQSHANFILFRVPPGQANEIFSNLQKQGVLIKNLHGTDDLLENCLRVTVGTPEENQRFLSALVQSL